MSADRSKPWTDMRVLSAGTCDACGAHGLVDVWERDYLDEPVSWLCADGCDDEDDDWGDPE